MKSLLEARSGPKMDSSSANALQELEMPSSAKIPRHAVPSNQDKQCEAEKYDMFDGLDDIEVQIAALDEVSCLSA